MIEKWTIHILTTVPDPGMTPGEYAIGVTIMMILLCALVVFVGDALKSIFPRLGGAIVGISVPGCILLGIVVWVFII